MDFEWDEAKDAANRAKHGIGLARAARLDWGRAIDVEDMRRDYGEVRTVSFARLDGRLHACTWTWRDGRKRIISLRKANRREVRRNG